jgi:tetratricopeptide (TPR) repeat protein
MPGRATTDEASVPKLRRFEIVRPLGAGGMGVVYEAIDRVEGRRVAIKTRSGLGPDLRLRFKNEFRALQGIHHDNLVRLGELFEEDGQLYYTMELVVGVPFLAYVRPAARAQRAERDGRDDEEVSSVRPSVRAKQLAALAERRAPSSSVAPPPAPPPGFDEKRLRAALAQLASGLAALHRAGRVHRDIKSSNVLVTAEGRLVILDFGLIADAAGAAGETGVVGTAHFMAPEQAAGLPVWQEADWYAVGVLLYVALTGELPFHAAADAAMSLKQRLEPQPPGRLVEGLPPDLAELCVGLLRRDPAERLSGIEAFWRLAAEEEPDVPRLVEVGDGFVGRERELVTLAEAFAEARRGEGAIAVIEGESGIGKSALFLRFLDATAGEALVFRGRCHERDAVPYKAVDAIIDALRRHLAGLPAARALALRPPGSGALETVFPELRARGDPTPRAPLSPHPVDPQVLRVEAFTALRELLRRVAEERPLCLAIDDIQWADADSLQLLSEVMRPPGAPRLLLLVTARTQTPAPAPPAPDDRPDAPASRRAVDLPITATFRVALERLPPVDAEALVGVLLGPAELGPGVDAAALAEEARGHPLFLDALVRHRLARTGDGGPVRLDEAIWSRVERLGAASRRLVEVVAVAGAPLDLDHAARVTATSADEVVRALVPAQGARLVRLTGAAGAELIEPYHDRVRETVLERLDAPAIRAWHARIAVALEASGRAALEALAVHWRGAGEPARAAAYAERAGEEAAGALAFDRAARLYDLALDLRRDGRPGGDDRALSVRLADALDHAGREAEAAQVYLTAAEGAPPGEAVALTRRAAGCFLRAGHVDTGLAVLARALGAVGLGYPRSTAAALVEIAVLRAATRFRGLDYVPRREDEIDPRALARVDVCWEACSGLGLVDPLRTTAFQARHLRLALAAGEPCRLTRALAFEAIVVATRGEPAHDRARALIARAEATAQHTSDPIAAGLLAAARGGSLYLAGRFRPSLRWLERAKALLRERCAGASWERLSVDLFGMWCLWFLGDLTEFCRRVPVSLREAGERGDRLVATCLRSGIFNGRWLLADDPAQARAEAREALGGWSQQGLHTQHLLDLWATTQHDLYVGPSLETFRVLTARRRELALSQLRVQLNRVLVHEQEARVALACAERGMDRRAMLAHALDRARALEREPAAWARPHALLVRAGHAAIRGAREEAARFADRAARGFEAMDMALHAAAARRRWGEMLGGEDGRRVAAAADDWMRAEGVVSPDRTTRMLAPGFGGFDV